MYKIVLIRHGESEWNLKEPVSQVGLTSTSHPLVSKKPWKREKY
jgi:broad specificity phosphatase PhoE